MKCQAVTQPTSKEKFATEHSVYAFGQYNYEAQTIIPSLMVDDGLYFALVRLGTTKSVHVAYFNRFSQKTKVITSTQISLACLFARIQS